MSGRRTVLKTIAGVFWFLSAGNFLRSLPAAAAPAPLDVVVRRHGAHFLVDGWVLTAQDLRALGIKVPGQDDL